MFKYNVFVVNAVVAVLYSVARNQEIFLFCLNLNSQNYRIHRIISPFHSENSENFENPDSDKKKYPFSSAP